MSDVQNPSDEYFASEQDHDRLAGLMNDRIDQYIDDLDMSGRITMWRRSLRMFYGFDADGGWSNSHAVTFGGDQGETVLLRSNEFRSLVRSMLTLTTGSRPSFNARPKNADSRSQQEAVLAEAILEYYISNHGLEKTAIQAAVYALLMGEGWYELRWDLTKGDPYAVEDVLLPGQEEVIAEYEGAYDAFQEAMLAWEVNPILEERPMEPAASDVEYYQRLKRTGDIATRPLKPEDVVRDISLESLENLQWVIVRSVRSRWDMMAEFPEFADEIRNAQRNVNRDRLRTRLRRTMRQNETQTDTVEVWELFHESCEALPRGRYVMMCGDTIILDDVMPYDQLPVHPMIPSIEIDEPYGYGETWGLMALQGAYDATLSVMVSNQAAFGLQNIHTTPGSNLTVKDLGGGLKHIESLVKPEPINLLPPNSISLELNNALLQAMQRQSGINDVARGEAQASQSGAALAMMASMAVQYNSSLQRAYGEMWEAAGTALVRVFQRWATIPRTIEVAGRLRTPQIKELSGDSIQNVNSIAVEMGNPLTRTSAGRKEIADKLLAAGAITDPDVYLEVQATGRVEAALERPRSQRTLIASENEALMLGGKVKALITDDHARHISEHSVILNEPSIRWDDELVARADYHIREHILLWAQATPAILAATGQMPPPPSMPPGGPMPGMPGAGGPPPGGPVGNGAGGGANVPQKPDQGAGAMPELPNNPKHPVTGVETNAVGEMAG